MSLRCLNSHVQGPTTIHSFESIVSLSAVADVRGRRRSVIRERTLRVIEHHHSCQRATGKQKAADLATGRFLLRHKTFKVYRLRSRKVEAIKVHHLVPGRYKVMDKLLLRIRTSIDFSQGPELGV
jgi:hypothetical protein